MEIKDEVYNYVQDSLEHNIIPSAHEISKICNAKYIRKEDILDFINKEIDSANVQLKHEFGDIDSDYEAAQSFDVDERIDFRSYKSKIETLEDIRGKILK